MSGERNVRCQNSYTQTDASTGNELDAAILGPRFLRGDVLAGRFEIVRFLARGGMGEVYEAEDRVLHNSRVALKTILARNALEPQARLHLKAEVMLAREIRHPNVCPIYDLFESEQPQPTCFLTMKLLHGETLAQRLRGAVPVPQQEALLITRQLCGALAAAHAARVIHRDLKPGNIMLQGAGAALKAVVTDFGIALEYEADRTISATAHIAGTPGYIAPEVLNGDPATPASDLYALGVVLCEMFTGRKPVSGSGGPASPSAAEQSSKIPVWCARLMTACLDAAPEVRSREFQRLVQQLGLEQTIAAEAPISRSISRRRLFRLGAAAAAGVAGGVLLYEDPWYGLLHPLPRKRFVAVVEFPPISDSRVRPLVQGVIETIESELSRAEAFDRDLCVMAVHGISGSGVAALRSVRDSFGANLALATQATLNGNKFTLLLKVLDSTTSAVLRSRKIVASQAEIQSGARRAVVTAAELLNVHLRGGSPEQPSFATSSEQAYNSFLAAENFMKQPNDAGLDKAMESYRAALDADPKYAIASSKLAIAYCRYFSLHGDPAALGLARKCAENGLKIDPNLVDGYIALSSVYDYQGDKQQALSEIAKALALDPTNPKTLFFQAQIYRRMNRRSEAVQIYRRILDQRPNYWVAYNELGCVLEEQGQYREAMDAFRSETIVNPRSYLAFANLGDMCFKSGKSTQATQNYRKSLELNPNEYALAGLGTVLRTAGNYAGALNPLMKATELSPSDDLNWLNLADCYESLHQEKRAREAYLRARKEVVEGVLALDSADSGAWMRLALYAIKTHQSGDPRRLVAKASPSDSLDLDTQVIEARIYELLGERELALATLRRCFDKGLTSIEITFIPDFQALKKNSAFAKLVAEH